jgi:hypothetical protein
VQVHHASERRCEAHAISDAAVAIQTDQFVTFGDVVQETLGNIKLLVSLVLKWFHGLKNFANL